MGRLIEGKWVTQDLGSDANGRYVRQMTQFRNTIPSPEYPAAVPGQNRYRLIVSHACGWSHRCMIVRALVPCVEQTVPMLFVDAFMGEDGWTFGNNTHVLEAKDLFASDHAKHTDDSIRIKAMHQLYALGKSDYTGRASVPVLWDTFTGTIVSNESSVIIRMFCDPKFIAQDDVAAQPIDLIPSELEAAIEEMVQANYNPINNGVYRCGFASSQEAYDEAVTSVFARLQELEELLGKQRYLMGNDRITLADICLFPTLYRFDEVYHNHFKCNKKHLYEYPNLWAYTRELYQQGTVKESCRMDIIKEHYYTSHESIHPRRYIPVGPDVDWEEPHGRDAQKW